MREAYLVNNSQSIASIPLYEKVPVVRLGRAFQKVQFKQLVPGEEFPVGTDISVAKKKYYSQFKPIMVELKFRNAIQVKEEAKIEPSEEEVNAQVPAEEPAQTPVEGKVEEPTETTVETPDVAYDEATLMKKRQGELIEIAASLGIEATTQNSKAEITKMILEKVLG